MSSSSNNNTGFAGLLNGGAGKAQENAGTSAGNLAASVAGGASLFLVQFLIFYLFKDRLKRIFRPRTYLVPEKERTNPPPSGLFRWLLPVFKTSNSEFIQKCGLDAYFFVRFLRLLLKIFCVLAIVIMPILLPINATGGGGVRPKNETAPAGLDILGWQNIGSEHTSRLWSHCILAILTIVYVCYIFYDELKGYIRIRQAYLTTPQHRIRASATTILVTNIPMKWLTVEALDGLFDVFPGGLRNIWVNRNYDKLSEKVEQRDKLARMLEGAETDLIKNTYRKHLDNLKAESKAARKAGKITKREEKLAIQQGAGQTDGVADEQGVSSGDPHQTPHTLGDILDEADHTEGPGHRPSRLGQFQIPILGQGLGALGHGVGAVGRGIDRLGRGVVDGVVGGINKVRVDVDGRLQAADMGAFAPVPVVDQDGHPINQLAVQPLDEPQPSIVLQEPPSAKDTSSSKTTLRPGTDPFSPVRSSRIAGRHALPPSDMKNAVEANTKSKLSFWLKGKTADFPSPQPHQREDDEFPLSAQSPVTPTANRPAVVNGRGNDDSSVGKDKAVIKSKQKRNPADGASESLTEYPEAYKEEFADDKGAAEPKWKQYISVKDRPTHHLPPFGQEWLSWLSWTAIGKKVDTVYYCRRELARLNVEIEQDQNDPGKFPLMSSAFIQFNHQVAAHMACQSVSHHLPKSMTPRMVEIDPKDVKWDNMSMKWWERYIRTFIVLALFVGLVILWAIPVTFTGFLSHIDTLDYTWLLWLKRWPKVALSIVQGILPQAILGLLLILLPIIIRLLVGQQGHTSGAAHELSVAKYYFAFLFVELFLVVSLSSGIVTILQDLSNKFADTIGGVPALLAANLPRASNYFFSYMVLQALSVSAGALVQLVPLIKWFGFSHLDNTAREKFQRQIDLPSIQWGTFFPAYANLAAIGLIYSVVAPLILVFNILTFGLFWAVYRYNSLYITRFTFDTGGLLFPQAINQLFTGVYVLELCLIGLFFLTRDAQGKASCIPQGAVMIAVTILTIIYQFLLNDAFGPLFKYLPITLEDDAVRRDEEFARAQVKRFHLADEEQEGDDIEEVLEEREQREREDERQAQDIELQQIGAQKSPHNNLVVPHSANGSLGDRRGSWADRSRNRRTSSHANGHPPTSPHLAHPGGITGILRRSVDIPRKSPDQTTARKRDVESQRSTDKSQYLADQLFSDLPDELEDLTPEERDVLVQHAFQHKALRARRPCIWLPRDELGVSDDEIARTKAFAGGNIWVSNEFTGLDRKGRVVFRKAPPDYSAWDLIQL